MEGTYVDYINRSSSLGVGIALIILVVAIVTARLAQRLKACNSLRSIHISEHLDDLFCLLAAFSTLGIAIVLVYGAQFVYIILILQPLDIHWFNKTIGPVLLSPNLCPPYIQRCTLRLHRHICGLYSSVLFGFTVTCGTSFAINWSSLADIGANCGFGFQATVAYGIFDAVLDFISLLLPLPMIWTLQMPFQRKIQVTFVFLLGGFALAAAIVRMIIFIEQNSPQAALGQATIMGMPPYDIIGITSAGLYWTIIEVNVALISCCLPTLHAIFTLANLGSALTNLGRHISSLGSALSSEKGSQYSSNISRPEEFSQAKGRLEVISPTSSRAEIAKYHEDYFENMEIQGFSRRR
ncbi:hypothetical protein PVAG01_10199 [Phlyctema vagabunda]|uniref:Rhodopsin domain-containing protein n=1 Tax=Phlyctema vagabunda TaxID=108571 RepID=A0ABR4P593_9HELO